MNFELCGGVVGTTISNQTMSGRYLVPTSTKKEPAPPKWLIFIAPAAFTVRIKSSLNYERSRYACGWGGGDAVVLKLCGGANYEPLYIC